jgi:hypothetical protein
VPFAEAREVRPTLQRFQIVTQAPPVVPLEVELDNVVVFFFRGVQTIVVQHSHFHENVFKRCDGYSICQDLKEVQIMVELGEKRLEVV